MESESVIYGAIAVEVSQEEGFYDFKLLKTTSYARLYRASKAGKHFIIKTTKDNSSLQRKMLRREYELSIGCDHPHVVHIYTIEEQLSVGLGIVMEYIEGRSLLEYIAEHPTRRERERIFEELLSAVKYLHGRGVIHNDLKPENILITRADNSLKLIDFGLADSDAHFALRTLGCTPQYASPELYTQSRVIDARSDIYSIGVLMGDIFGGRYRGIAKRCRNANPDKRYENTTALQLAWAHRHRPLRVVLTVVASLIFLLPLFLFGQTKLAEHNKTREREELFAKIECDVEDIYAVVADSISRATYYEFANNHLLSFWEELAKYQQHHIATIPDAELNILATNVYTHKVNRCNEDLIKQTNALPFMVCSGLPIEEQLFYHSLLASRKPYHPYSIEP